MRPLFGGAVDLEGVRRQLKAAEEASRQADDSLAAAVASAEAANAAAATAGARADGLERQV